MKCPHCLNAFHDSYKTDFILDSKEGYFYAVYRQCPECVKAIINIVLSKEHYSTGTVLDHPASIIQNIMVWPKATSRPPCPPEVPSQFSSDYLEACLVLMDSPKASAALSRRCLQNILREKAGVKSSDLSNEIEQVLDNKVLPSHIAEIIDAVRHIGNFAAHPIKSKSTGEIIDVEPGEAELNLDVLEALFDFYFVGPALVAKKRDALNKKLQDAGKPPVKH